MIGLLWLLATLSQWILCYFLLRALRLCVASPGLGWVPSCSFCAELCVREICTFSVAPWAQKASLRAPGFSGRHCHFSSDVLCSIVTFGLSSYHGQEEPLSCARVLNGRKWLQAEGLRTDSPWGNVDILVQSFSAFSLILHVAERI